jgi:NAD+ synthase (glutamine-hydrolysing)
MRLVMAQANLVVGDIEGNADRVLRATAEARQRLAAELVVFPELTLTGYPPEDLLLRPSLDTRIREALHRIGAETPVPVLLGYPVRHGETRLNTLGLIRPGAASPEREYYKQRLPNYRVLDEKRYFAPGDGACVVEVAGVTLGLSICEDIWFPEPMQQARAAGAQVIVNINASPFRRDKHPERLDQVAEQAQAQALPVCYCNLVGGQDELIFDGGSFVMDGTGRLVAQGAFFNDGLIPVDIDLGEAGAEVTGERLALPDEDERIYQALVLAVRDYIHKNGFRSVVVGLSGGIDSAMTLMLAVDALGADCVEAVMMPYHYTADISREDAAIQAAKLGVQHHVLPIESAVTGFMEQLEPVFEGHARGVTEENLQSRCRGVLLMALSNKHGALVLTTGNKSELAVGYATLYGDMVGGFAPLKDVSKTRVYRLARWRNARAGEALIPARVIERPPSAELAPDQLDEDSLPGYDTLDPLLERYVEQDYSAERVIRAGFDRDTVYRVVRMVDGNEYKRKQAPVGPRVSRRAFGKDRRYPITNGWRAGD